MLEIEIILKNLSLTTYGWKRRFKPNDIWMERPVFRYSVVKESQIHNYDKTFHSYNLVANY